MLILTTLPFACTRETLMFPESEQGASTKGHCSPASLELNVALEWNPKFILRTEPGYEQCRQQQAFTFYSSMPPTSFLDILLILAMLRNFKET